MHKSRSGTIGIIMMLLVISGCRKIVTVVPPGDTGTAPSYVAKEGETLEWRTSGSHPSNFTIVFDNSPCEKGENNLPGTPDAPAHCKVAKQPNGQGYIYFNYEIKYPESKNFSAIPCKGCRLVTGSPVSVSSSSGQGQKATAPAAADGGGDIQLDCSNKTITADPTELKSTKSAWWTQGPNAVGWQVNFGTPQQGQTQLCVEGTQFNAGNYYCTFNDKASSTYYYTVSNITGCSMPAQQPSFTITVGTPNPTPTP